MQDQASLYIPCTVQQDGGSGWFDVSELFGYLPAAEAALKRWQEDRPDRRFRLASPEWGADQ